MPHIFRTVVAASALDPEVKKNLLRMLKTDVVAAAGSAQTDAALLTAGINIVTGANATLAVRLPPSEIDLSVTVLNAAAAALPVFPDSDDAINAGGADNVFTQAASTERTYRVTALGQWYVQVA
jgi:hypothetical protein